MYNFICRVEKELNRKSDKKKKEEEKWHTNLMFSQTNGCTEQHSKESNCKQKTSKQRK